MRLLVIKYENNCYDMSVQIYSLQLSFQVLNATASPLHLTFCLLLHSFRVGTANIGTLKDRSGEIVDNA